MRSKVLKNFGIENLGTYTGARFQEARDDVVDAMEHREMLAIIGEAGAGKSVLFQHAAREMKIRNNDRVAFVHVNDWFREKMTISNIMNAILLDLGPYLGENSIRRCMEARSRQCTRVLGQTYIQEGKKIVIVIEQGHRMHLNTIIALKELREAKFAGEYPLCSVVLLGHPRLESKIKKRDEVALRTDFVHLTEDKGWMDFEERKQYLQAVYGDVLDKKARERVASRKKTPLQIYNYMKEKMQELYEAGYEQVTADDVDMSLRELKEIHGFSYADIAREAGISKSSVSNVMNSSDDHKLAPEVRKAMERLEEKEFDQAVKEA